MARRGAGAPRVRGGRLRIPFHRPSIGAAEIEAVVRALESGRLGGNGEVCRRVQARLAEIAGVEHALLTPNATQATELALLAMGVSSGEEVLLPSFAYVGQANAILACGARPVFCEIDRATLNLDPADAERRVTARTRVVLPVHYAGVACDLDALGALAERHGLRLLEDAAQACGSRWRGRHLGAVGDAGFLSFHETKNLACGEGGALLTSDDALFRAAEIAQEKGTDRNAFLRGRVERYTWHARGGGHVLSDVLAALLEVQLARLAELTSRRLELWNLYHDGLAELDADGFIRRPDVPEQCEHNGHLYAVRARSPRLRDRLLDGLRRRGIEATFHFQPLHASPFAREHLGTGDLRLPVTEEAAATLVRLPLFADLPREDVHRVIDEVSALCRSAAANV